MREQYPQGIEKSVGEEYIRPLRDGKEVGDRRIRDHAPMFRFRNGGSFRVQEDSEGEAEDGGGLGRCKKGGGDYETFAQASEYCHLQGSL